MSRKRNHSSNSNVRAARRRAGLTQEQLAVRAGITAKTLRDIENGTRVPQRATLTVIGLALEEFGETLEVAA